MTRILIANRATRESRKRRHPTMAERADRHRLYERAVQCPEADVDFINVQFRRIRKREPRTLREDFCGTAYMSTEWVKQRRKNTAVGVDIDPHVLAWGEANHLAKLPPGARQRIQLLRGNVMTAKTPPVDVLLAMNFSYQLFMERKLLKRYFRRVHNALGPDGVFFLDSFGGYDAFRELRESTEHRNFTYIWEHKRYNPINGELECRIHFTFPDGSRLNNAFVYVWRLWTLPELQELLAEAGFRNVTVYWQGTDERTGEGNGVFEPATVGDADPGWICYLSAEK